MKSMSAGVAALLAGCAVTVFTPAWAQNEAAALDAAYATRLLPPEASPGECYARVYIPAQTERVPREVAIQEESIRLEVIPAIYETVEETVEIASAAQELEIIPAVYETREKVIVVEPEREEIEVIPAEYETIEERVLIRQEYTTWKRGSGPIQRYDEATGEIMCLVTIPAEYETVEKRVVRTPARTVSRTIPAITETIQVRVMVEPPRTRTIELPPQYETIAVQKLVEPSRVTEITIPEETVTVYETVKAAEGRMEWRPILCADNVSEDLILRLQQALQSKGYNPGPVDGALGRSTIDAVRRFQRDNELAEGQITIETLALLDVDVR